MSSLFNRTGSFPLLRNGELIPVSVQLNQLTKFSKLQVGKNIVTAKQRHGSQNPLFPQSIALSNLAPLQKVWADYLPLPKNEFLIKVNDFDYYTLVREEIDFDPTQIELFKCEKLVLNDLEALSGQMPWVYEEVEEKINKVYKGIPLENLEIEGLDCKPSVAN